MSQGNASARPRAADGTAEGPAAAVSRTHAAGAARATGADAPAPVSLAQIIASRNHRPMLRLQALQVLEGICRGLDHAHRNGCVHGDVQPGNILVTAEGQVRLIGHNSAPTPAYASCEVLEGAAPVPADDLFAAACTGYVLLAGEAAFGTATALEAEAAARRPARISHLSPGQWRALERALAFRRADRQPDVETFLNELRSQYPGQSAADATASLPSLPVSGAQAGRSPRLPLMAGGLAGIAALVIAMGWWLLRTPETPAGSRAPAVATGEAGLIVRADVAPVAATAPALPTTMSAGPPQALPAQPPPAVAATLPVGTARKDTAPAAPLPPMTGAEIVPPVVAPVAPEQTTAPPALIEPRPVVPALPADMAPAIILPATLAATPAADDGAHLVPFSSLKVRRYVEPDYPRNGQGVHTAGWVDVSFSIDAVGRTTALQVDGAEPPGVFEEAALAAVRRWRFAPVEAPAGTGQTVRSEVRVRFIPD
jgi:TonB family protein